MPRRLWLAAFLGLAAGADSAQAVEPRPLFSRPPAAAEAPRPALTRSPEAMTEAIRAERDAFTRRLDVCTQLRRIAADTNDERLAQRALDLEQIAEDTYRQRIARLGVKSDLRTLPAGMSTPANIGAASTSTAALDRTLGSGTAVTPLTVAPPKPATPATATAQSRQFREVPQQ